MNPSNNDQSSLSTIEQDELAKKWTYTSISQILPFLVWYFKDLVHRIMGHYSKDYNGRIEYMKKNSQYVFDKQTLELLLRAFRGLYPRLSYEFDKMIKEEPYKIEYYKKHTEYLHEKSKRQETCEHEYKQPAMTIYGYYGKLCSKCDHIKRVKMPDSEIRRVKH